MVRFDVDVGWVWLGLGWFEFWREDEGDDDAAKRMW